MPTFPCIDDVSPTQMLGALSHTHRRNPRFATCLLTVAAFLHAITPGNVSAAPPVPSDQPASTEDSSKAPSEDTPPPPETHEILLGQVTNDCGSGIPGVVVTLQRKAKEGGDGELIGTAKTDDVGDFSIRLLQRVAGSFTVRLAKEKLTTHTLDVILADEGYAEFIGAEMSGTILLKGKLIDVLTRKPIHDADIQFETPCRDWDTKSAADGTFAFDGLADGEGTLIVEAEAYGREAIRGVLVSLDELKERAKEKKEEPTPPTKQVDRPEKAAEQPTTDVPADKSRPGRLMTRGEPGSIISEWEIELKPERVVHLHVVDDAGASIAGVTIEAFDKERDDFRTVVTDDNGQATLRRLHFDVFELALRLTHPLHVSSLDFDRSIEPPEDKTESTHEVILPRAGLIAGKITAKATGNPIAGARVMTGTEGGDSSPRAWSDYRGEYRITGVPPGVSTLTVHAAGYAPQLASADVHHGDTTEINLELRTPATIAGIVTDDAGKVVAGATVEAGLWRENTTLGLRARTNDEGRFVITDAPHDEFEITVFGPHGGSATRKVKAGDTAPIEIALAPTRPGATPGKSIATGEKAPDFSITTLDEKTIDLASLKGKVVLLDFWATWCGPCVGEIPSLIALHAKHGENKNFVMLGISLDGNRRSFSRFVKKKKLTWPQAIGKTAEATANTYGVQAIPATFLIDPDGTVIAADLRGEQLTQKVDDILKVLEAK